MGQKTRGSEQDTKSEQWIEADGKIEGDGDGRRWQGWLTEQGGRETEEGSKRRTGGGQEWPGGMGPGRQTTAGAQDE